MSCRTKSQFNYLNNQNQTFSIDKDDEDLKDFNFQYVPINQFKHIIKDVKRKRTRDKEEKVWANFLKEEEQSALNCQKICSDIKYKSSRTLAQSFEEVDRELMRLKGDNIPETFIRENNPELRTEKQDSPITKENSTDRSNFLLTIPKEKNVHCQIESSDSCKPCKTIIKKSCSDQTFKKNKINTKYYYSTNDLDCNSSTDISPNQLSNENDSIFEHPDPVVVTKILHIQRKISAILDSISNELDRVPLPDGENDFQRRQKRTVEFSTRLSRNYLYDLSRQISDIERHIKAINPISKVRLSRRGLILHMQAIEQKLISTHQLLLAALNAYWKHIPSAVLKGYPGKLKEILQIVVQLKNICIEVKLIPDFYCSGDEKDAFLGKETENRCSIILSKFRLNSDNESQVPSHTTRSTIITPSCNKKQRSRKLLSNRLSMYTMDMRLAKNYQIKKSRNRLQMPRDRKHSGTLSKQQRNMLSMSKKLQLNSRINSSNETIRNKSNKISIPMKEDDIQTVMETFPSDLDLDSHQSIKSDKKSEIYKELYKSTEILGNIKESVRPKKNKSNDNEQESNDSNAVDQCFSTFSPAQKDLLNKNNSTVFPLTTMRSFFSLHQKLQSTTDMNELDSQINYQNKMNLQNIRVSYFSAIEEKEENSKINNKTGNKEEFQYTNVSCQANYLDANGIFELLLSEPATSVLMKYRNEYKSSLKSNPMYTNNTKNKPWEVVAWIADKLVDELIIQLSDDFQMEEIIQKLFELEFQEF